MSETFIDFSSLNNITDLGCKLKYYMYITNEYGKPSKENLKNFCSTFLSKCAGRSTKEFSFPSINQNQNQNPTQKDLNNLWKEIRKDLDERNINKFKRNGGHLFFLKLKEKVPEINLKLKEYAEEEKEKVLMDLIDNIEFKEKVNSKELKEIALEWKNSGMYKEGDRLLSIPTGNPGENLWYAYDEENDKLKVIENSGYKITVKSEDFNKHIIDYLDTGKIDCKEIIDDKGNAIDIENLKELDCGNFVSKIETTKNISPISGVYTPEKINNAVDTPVTDKKIRYSLREELYKGKYLSIIIDKNKIKVKIESDTEVEYNGKIISIIKLLEILNIQNKLSCIHLGVLEFEDVYKEI